MRCKVAPGANRIWIRLRRTKNLHRLRVTVNYSVEPFLASDLQRSFSDRKSEVSAPTMRFAPSGTGRKRPHGDPWYAVALDSIGDAVIAADAQGRVTYLNPTAEQLTGWEREQAIGQDIARVYDLVDEETGQELTRVLADIALGGEAIQVKVDMLLIARGGEHVPVKDTAAPIRDELKAVIGVVVAFHDVSAERKAQKEIEALNSRLRLALAEMNHRVKNNLQVVAALVEMQAQSETEPLPVRAAQRLSLHVRTLAQIHDQLKEQAMHTDIGTLSARDTVRSSSRCCRRPSRRAWCSSRERRCSSPPSCHRR